MLNRRMLFFQLPVLRIQIDLVEFRCASCMIAVTVGQIDIIGQRRYGFKKRAQTADSHACIDQHAPVFPLYEIHGYSVGRINSEYIFCNIGLLE